MATSRAGSSSTSPEPDFPKVQFMSPLHIRPIARRRFVQGLAIGGAVAGFAPALLARSAPVSPAELCGTEFDLEIAALDRQSTRMNYRPYSAPRMLSSAC